MTTCELIELQPQPTLIIRTETGVQSLPQVLGDAFENIVSYLGELGELPHGAPFVAYFNMDMDNLQIEAGFPVSKPIPGREDIQAGEFPPGQYATATFTGPYHEMAPAYDMLTAWIQENGREPTGTAYEIYLNDVNTTPPEELKTQILFPLK